MEESPLHPFELHNWISISLAGLDISINKAVVMMWVVVSLVAVLMVMAGAAATGAWQVTEHGGDDGGFHSRYHHGYDGAKKG